MSMQWDLRLLVTLLAAAATPAVGQTSAVPASIGIQGAAAIPDFSGVWRHPSLPGLEPLASGPTSLTNRVRRRSDGASDYNRLVGDYSNPILQPWAAQAVKKFGDLSMAGVTNPNPANQCWPEPVPFIYKNFGMLMLQQPDKITIIYSEDHEIRWVRMNQSHPAHVTPSWHGDSVGHYEGDTLVIDTVGTRTDRPFAMIDLFGTPFTQKLHVVERYRLIDYEDAKEGLDRDAKENQLVQRETMDRAARGKYLQVRFTVEDDGAFTTPWSATVTYGRSLIEWLEIVCPENRHEYYYNKNSEVPTADKPDF
jgi:hypothetical protein